MYIMFWPPRIFDANIGSIDRPFTFIIFAPVMHYPRMGKLPRENNVAGMIEYFQYG